MFHFKLNEPHKKNKRANKARVLLIALDHFSGAVRHTL